MQRRRNRPIDLLTADPPVSAEAVGDLAHTAQWVVPRELAVVVVRHAPQAESAPPLVPPGFLARFGTRPGVIVVPGPEGPARTRALAAAPRGLRAVAGPTVAPGAAARSLRWASSALELSRRGSCRTRNCCAAPTTWRRCCCSTTTR
ncbi:hypothetical protein [Streptomyces sp. NPDC047071]|uniref:hypothetical protein n=1 Tax=Streptomyces sp. NPDC047071 TaxID=3154808 RepID=UPI003455A708